MNEAKDWIERELPEFSKHREAFRFDNLQAYDWRASQNKGVVLVVHGFSESAVKLQEVCWHFYQLGYDVIAYDQRGHGCSARLCGDPSLVHIDTFESYVRDLAALIDLVKENTSEPVILYGHSMGGAVCAIAASRLCPSLEKVILSSPMVRPQTAGLPYSLAHLIASLLCLNDPAGYVPGSKPYEKESFACSAGTCREFFDWYSEIRQRDIRYQTVAPSCGWLKSTAQVERQLKKTTQFPTCLLIQCKDDAFVVNRRQDWFIEKVHGQKCVFDHVKHEIYNSPDSIRSRYWSVIEQFLRS